MVFRCWSLIPFKLPQNSIHQWLSRRNDSGTPFNYCPPNCTKFLLKIHLSHSNQSKPCTQEMVFTWWGLIRFNYCPPNCTMFFSRSILATQTNLSLILKKWGLHAGVWLPSNCHKTKPTNGIQEEMIMEPPSITVVQFLQSFFSRSILAN